MGTGGYTAEISGAIFRSVASLSGDITTQYVMRYTPDIAPGTSEKTFRRIKVAVSLQNQESRFVTGSVIIRLWCRSSSGKTNRAADG